MTNGATLDGFLDWGTRKVFVRTVAVAHKVFIRHAKHMAEVKGRTCSCVCYPHGCLHFMFGFYMVLPTIQMDPILAFLRFLASNTLLCR